MRQRHHRGGHRRPRRWRRVTGYTLLIVALLTGVGAVIPPVRDAAINAALLWSGEIGAPSDLRAVALCASTQPGLGAWLARRIIVPRGRVIKGMMASEALHGARRAYYVYLPPGYDLAAFHHTRYPAVYLLHGSPGQAPDWYVGGHINTVADRLISTCRMIPMILVMPDGNGGVARDSEYINRWDGSENDETYMVRDVVGFIDRHFRTIPNARFRAILGLSEGGYGAANLTVRNPTVFGSAVAISAYFRASPGETLPWDNPYGHDRSVMAANSPILRVVALPPVIRRRLHFLIYDGADDQEYSPSARAFTRQLAREHIAFYWDRRHDTALVWRYHNWMYWRASARDALTRLSALFMRRQAA